MTHLDYWTCQQAFSIAADLMRFAGHSDLADFYASAKDRIAPEIAGLIRENAPPPAIQGRITSADVARNLNREVSKVRDLGGSVILAWFVGTGPRFVSRRAIFSV